jgi:PPE-repeat protein
LDYGAEIPEVNSGRIYTGPGSGPLAAAAAAWTALAGELAVSATNFAAICEALATGPWLGPSSMKMLTAALPYVSWLAMQAAQAEERSALHMQHVSAFETAHMTVVPPEAIAENRSELAALVASNVFGQNTPAIAANEAEYAGFWATDASTLYDYAAQATAISAATEGSPFLPAVPSTDPAGLAGQAAAVGADAGQQAGTAGQGVSGAMSNLGSMGSGAGSAMSGATSAMGQAPQAATQALQGLAQGGQQMMQPLMGMMSQFGQMLPAGMAAPMSSLLGMVGPGGGGFSPVSASMGGAGRLANTFGLSNGAAPPRLSVPATWAGSAERYGASRASVVTSASALSAEENTGTMAAMPRGGMMPAIAGMGAGQGGPAKIPEKEGYPKRLQVVQQFYKS